ncbi:DNA polymerase III subunit delta' [Roseateles sp. SL47]|uniref:DNA polymerase III subunit delta' n=1 Tax=Roseateles sp. SL47 TaxID=2995138 RepID=UPI00226FA18C|nr:DNA polymerase III subunit delta' [Roseateles sp. SL47]WAC70916.1 DNA polymerase III subunit delta' [Roseateles sp. SL47]
MSEDTGDIAALARDGQLPLPWLAAPLQQALTQGRSHALLLQGPAGVGQFDLALLLAQAWLCESRAAPDQPGCGRCASCHLLRSRSHPDFQVLLPEALREPLGFGAQDAEGSDTKASKTKPSREIKIEAVRQVLSFSQVSAARGKAKVVVVYPAEALNTVAANALLKTLEEPQGLLRFVLASAAPQQLLPTIRSRCQPLQMALPARDAAVTWLTGQGVASPEVLLDATGGRPQEALLWSEEGIAAKTWLELPRRIAKGEAQALTDWPVPRAIAAMQRLVHDLMRIAHGAPPSFFPRDALPKLPAVRTALDHWARTLQQAARHAEHPLNAGLLMESLVAQGQQAMRPAR